VRRSGAADAAAAASRSTIVLGRLASDVTHGGDTA